MIINILFTLETVVVDVLSCFFYLFRRLCDSLNLILFLKGI